MVDSHGRGFLQSSLESRYDKGDIEQYGCARYVHFCFHFCWNSGRPLMYVHLVNFAILLMSSSM